jgi:nucleoid-associated protein YgaU
MEYDYEPSDEFAGRVLWGRVGVFVGALLLMFLLGRCSAGGSDVDPARVEFLEGQVSSLQQENEQLQNQLEAVSAGQDGQTGARPTPAPQDDAGESAGDNAAPAAETRTYVVQRGDTLYSIAAEHYGDGTRFQLIADANGIDSSNRLTVGQELTIPPAPSG